MNQTIQQIADKNALRFSYTNNDGSFNISIVRYENSYYDSNGIKFEYKYYLYVTDLSYIYRGNLIKPRISLAYTFYPNENRIFLNSRDADAITPGFNKVLLKILGDFVIPHLKSVNYNEALDALYLTSNINSIKRQINDKKKELEKLEGELTEKSKLETETVKEYITKLEEGTL